jgi:hypothetical protein
MFFSITPLGADGERPRGGRYAPESGTDTWYVNRILGFLGPGRHQLRVETRTDAVGGTAAADVAGGTAAADVAAGESAGRVRLEVLSTVASAFANAKALVAVEKAAEQQLEEVAAEEAEKVAAEEAPPPHVVYGLGRGPPPEPDTSPGLGVNSLAAFESWRRQAGRFEGPAGSRRASTGWWRRGSLSSSLRRPCCWPSAG